MKRLPFKDEFVGYKFNLWEEELMTSYVTSIVFGKVVIPFSSALIRINMIPARFRLPLGDTLLKWRDKSNWRIENIKYK